MTGRRAVLCYPSRTAAAIAEVVVRAWTADGCATVVVDPAAPPPDDLDHVLVVLPVLGDERMPVPMEHCLARWRGRSRSHRICLTGDFRTGQRASPVADEADRVLRGGGSTSSGPPLLVDTPVEVVTLVPLLTAELGVVRAAPDDELPLPELEPPLRRLVQLLPGAPRLRLDPDGRCESLALVDGTAYPHSLLTGATADRVGEVLALARELPGLRRLGLPFAGLEALPGPLPAGLTTLDLRGNPLARWDVLEDQRSVTALNLAGCDLAEVPAVLASLDRLDTLVLAKNRLEGGLRVLALPGLRRLTLYRNQLRALDLPAGELPRLRLLNVGANPLPDLPGDLALQAELEVLGLRMLPLEAVPAVLAELPALRAVDLSKTRFAATGVPGRPDVRSLDGMPRWAWDDDADVAAPAA